MRKDLLQSVIVLITITITTILPAGASDMQQKDSVLFFEREAQRNKLIEYYNNQQTDDFNREIADIMEFFRKNGTWEDYFFAWGLKIDMQIFATDHEEALSEAQEMYQFAKEKNIRYGTASALHVIGSIYQSLGRLEDSEDVLRQAIHSLKGSRDVSEMSLLYDTYVLLNQTLLELLKFTEVEKELADLSSLIDLFEEQYANHNIEESVRTKRLNLSALYALLFIETKEFDKAAEHIKRMESSSNSLITKQQVYNRKIRLAEAQKKYDEALKFIAELEKSYQSTNENNLSLIYLYDDEIRIAEKKGNLSQALNAYRKQRALSDSIQRVEMNERLDNLRTQYDVDRHIEEKTRNRNYAFLLAVALLLAIAALSIWIVYSRRLHAKNIRLVKQIRELDCNTNNDKANKTSPSDPQTASETNASTVNVANQLKTFMKQKKPYTSPDINRKVIADMLGTNETYLRNAIKEEYGLTFSEYITELRLNHAKDMLIIPSEQQTIESIAIDSGFGSRSTMHRLFRNKFGLSPDEFRKINLELISEKGK